MHLMAYPSVYAQIGTHSEPTVIFPVLCYCSSIALSVPFFAFFFSLCAFPSIFFLLFLYFALFWKKKHTARSRFNLRTSSANNGTTSSDETADNVAAGQSTTTQRTARPRPSFNLRGRSRPTPLPVPSTAAASAAEETAAADNESPAAGGVEPKPDDEKAAVAAKPASRFNLRRPNQLLSARGRVSPLLKASTEAPAKSDDATDAAKEVTAVIANDNRNKEAPSDEGDQANTETSTQPQSGLNRLRNRPRIQIKPRASTSSENKSSTLAAYNVNRKANPLIARRKIGSTTSTTG